MNNCQIYLTKISAGRREYHINKIIEDYLDSYFSLRIAGRSIITPYYINVKKRKDLNALVGKGTPDEIVLETKVWAQAKKVNLRKLDAAGIRDFMLHTGIGIDCSGLVSLALDHYFRACHGRGVFSRLRYADHSLRGKLARMLRPATNLSANELTGELNTKKVELNDVKPGDLIRGIGKQRNAYHVAIVTKVIAEIESEKELTKEIHYVHSHRGYGVENGMRLGKVLITDIKKDWWQQEWQDFGSDGKNYLLENDLLPEKDDCGFRRLDVVAKLMV